MDVTAMRRSVSGNIYQKSTAESGTSESGFAQAVRESQDRLQQEEEDLWQVIADRKEEIEEKLRSGDTEVKYQIGAGSYTQKEWERMMEQFDSLEEIIKRMMSERAKKQRQQAYWQVLGKPGQEEETEI